MMRNACGLVSFESPLNEQAAIIWHAKRPFPNAIIVFRILTSSMEPCCVYKTAIPMAEEIAIPFYSSQSTNKWATFMRIPSAGNPAGLAPHDSGNNAVTSRFTTPTLTSPIKTETRRESRLHSPPFQHDNTAMPNSQTPLNTKTKNTMYSQQHVASPTCAKPHTVQVCPEHH
jgi:hypothetical protein